MKQSVEKLKVALRVESLLLQRKLERFLRSVVLVCLALLFALLAVIVFNFAAFRALEDALGPTWAGVAVVGFDLGMAALLGFAALKKPGVSDEETLALELRRMAYDSLEEDLDSAASELREFVRDLRSIRAVITRVTSWFTSPLHGFFELFKSSSHRSDP